MLELLDEFELELLDELELELFDEFELELLDELELELFDELELELLDEFDDELLLEFELELLFELLELPARTRFGSFTCACVQAAPPRMAATLSVAARSFHEGRLVRAAMTIPFLGGHATWCRVIDNGRWP